MTQWDVCDIELTARGNHDWWSFPVVATFAHVETGTRMELEGFWNGGNCWVIRFAPTLVGEWTWCTSSSDPGLDGRSGSLTAEAPTREQLDRNPNYR